MLNSILERIYECNQELTNFISYKLPVPFMHYTNKPIIFAVPGEITEPAELVSAGHLVRIYEIELNVAVRPVDLNYRDSDQLSQAIEETVNAIETIITYYNTHRRLSTEADPEDFEAMYADLLIDCDGVVPEFEGPDTETWVGTVVRLSIPLVVNLF